MPNSPPGNEPGSQSGSTASESEGSDSSSSDFEIQAVTTADGTRTETRAEETNKSDENEQPQDESKAANEKNTSPNGNLADALGLGAYSESSSSDEDHITKSATAPSRRQKKRVRFADDPPEKRQRVERKNGHMNGPVNGHLRATGDDEADEVAVLAELAEFEAAVADAGRDTDDIEADLADADDARQEAEQHDLEERVKRLREEVVRRKRETTAGVVNDLGEDDSFSLDEDSDEGPDDLSKIGTRFVTN